MSHLRKVVCFIACGYLPLAGSAAGPVGPETSIGLDPARIVEGLPWAFSIDIETDAAASGPGTVHHRFTSTEPYRRTAQGSLFLRADLTTTSYASPEGAREAYARLLEKADPDMGLSYAWDRVILASGTLFHLHAACTFSEASFEQMADRLDRLARPLSDGSLSGLSCRCGGGCRAD